MRIALNWRSAAQAAMNSRLALKLGYLVRRSECPCSRFQEDRRDDDRLGRDAVEGRDAGADAVSGTAS